MSTNIPGRKRVIKNGRNRKTRAKTFKSVEAANTYAKTNGITDFKLVNIKSTDSKLKKIRIISN